MLRKASHEFESGVELDFDRIRLSRADGVGYRRWFAWNRIQWQDLTEYGLSESHMNLESAKKFFKVNIAAEKIANTHVLESLLDKIRKGAMSVGTVR